MARKLVAVSLVVFVLGVAWSTSARTAEPRLADLRLQFTGLPEAARVGGGVTYAARLTNIGHASAKRVTVDFNVGPSVIVSISARGIRCEKWETPSRVRCAAASLPPRGVFRIELATRAVELGRLTATATAFSTTHEATMRNNSGSVKTRVVQPDSVHVAATRHDPGRLPISLTMDAISGPYGQDSEGSFTLEWTGITSSGRVICLNVSENKAFVGAAVDVEAGAPAAREGYVGFLLVDNGSPGAGRDTLTFGGGGSKPSCAQFGSFPPNENTPPIAIGEITITDTR